MQRKNPLIVVESTEDVKTIKLGCLTCDENETVDSVVFRGLGFAKGLIEKTVATGTPFVKDLPGPTLKKESEELGEPTEEPKSPEDLPLESQMTVPDLDQTGTKIDDPQSPEKIE